MKKKALLLSLTLLLLFALTGCGGGGDTQQEGQNGAEASYNWKFVLGESTGSPQEYYANLFKDKIAQLSGGKVNVTIYTVGQLGSGGDQGELIQSGAIEMGFLPVGDAGSMIPESNLLSLHYIFPSDTEKAKEFMANSQVLKTDLPEAFAAKGLQVIDWLDEGYNVWTGNRPLQTPADFKGFKMRTMASQIIMDSFAAYGANPVNIAYSELYSALQLKMADGQTNPFEEILNMKFYEVQSDCTVANADVFMAALVVNKDLWAGLPEEAKGWFQQAVQEVSPDYNAHQQKMADEAVKELEANNVTVTYLTDEEISTFRELSKKAYDSYYQVGGPNAKALLDKFLEEAKAYY